MKVEILVEDGPAAGTFARKVVRFNSTANPQADTNFGEVITVAAGVIVRVTMTNLDNQPQNMYSTILGVEV